MMSETKSFVFDTQPKSATTKTVAPVKKERSIRKETSKWKFDNKYLELENQWICLQNLQNKTNVNDDVHRDLKRQLQNKISSYKMQDIQKQKYDEDKIVDFNFVVSLLVQKELRCYYCKESVYLFYNYVRENKQWTLDRIDNDMGHNKDNVEIACLHCNLRRRTMYHERYVFTKQLNVVKLA